MSDFISYCNNISPLSKDAADDLLSKLKSKTYKKGELINKKGQICGHLFFIEKGLIKHYYHHKNRLFILRFFSENNIFTILDSFLNQTPAEFMTIAMESTAVTYLDYQDIEKLCIKHHSFETFIRKYISVAAVNLFKRFKDSNEVDATELYQAFEIENKQLLQRISLGDIAGYLGISQVTLSRIRAKK